MQKVKIFWYKFKARGISFLVNLFAKQTNFDIKNSILLIGSARSGTTFLMESLNSKNDYRIIFEPFNPTYTKEWSAYSARHFIDIEAISDNEKQIVDQVICGRINNRWIDQYNRKFRSDKRLIKSVRANLMLDFMEEEYPDLQIVYTYRSPYSLVASRMSLNFDAKDVFLALAHTVFIKKYYPDIDIATLTILLNTPEGCHTALWCFENRYILNDMEQRRLMIVKYEDMIGKTIVIDKQRLLITEELRRPSVTSSLHKPYHLTDVEIGNISEVLRLFGMQSFFKSIPN